jgi:hypothetical protein
MAGASVRVLTMLVPSRRVSGASGATDLGVEPQVERLHEGFAAPSRKFRVHRG